MFVSIIFCKESINGEVIFMFMAKNKCDYLSLFSVLKLKNFDISSNFSLYGISQIFEEKEDIYS